MIVALLVGSWLKEKGFTKHKTPYKKDDD